MQADRLQNPDAIFRARHQGHMTGLLSAADAYLRAAAGHSELTSATRVQVTSFSAARETHVTALARGESGD